MWVMAWNDPRRAWRRCLTLAAAAMTGLPGVAQSQEGAAPGGILSNLSATNLPIRHVEGGMFEVGGVRFDKTRKTASFPAQVNMNEGLIEYLIVSSAGKLHESLLRTTIEPVHLHVVMLLLGAKGAPQPAVPSSGAAPSSVNADGAAVPFRRDRSMKSESELKGDAVRIRLIWKMGAAESECRAEDLVLNGRENAPMTPGDWAYTGSMVIDGTFLAQRDRSIAAIIDDPFALINNPRPGRDNDGIWQVNPAMTPPVGTPVRVVIQLKSPGRED